MVALDPAVYSLQTLSLGWIYTKRDAVRSEKLNVQQINDYVERDRASGVSRSVNKRLSEVSRDPPVYCIVLIVYNFVVLKM